MPNCNTSGMRPYSYQKRPSAFSGCSSAAACARPSVQEGFTDFPIAMAYVPWQHFVSTYELDKALSIGTIFPELDKPFLGKRGCRS